MGGWGELKNLDLIVHGNGQQKRDYICVKDLAKGSMIALKKEAKNKVITLSSKKNMKIIDLAKTIIWLTESKSNIALDKKKKEVSKNLFDDPLGVGAEEETEDEVE